MADQPYIRSVKLTLGPLKENEGGGGSGLSIESDGSMKGLRIAFSVTKTLMSPPNPSEITLYNLSRNTRAAMQKSLLKAELYVGYVNTGMNLLSRGAVLNTTSTRQGADVVTKVKFLDGYAGQVQGVSNKTLAPGQSVNDAVKAIAADMPGVTVGQVDVEGSLGSRGRSVSAPTKEILDQMSDEYGFSWSIQDGVLQAVSDKKSLPGLLVVGNPSKNLINCSPLLTGPMQIKTGVEIEAILDSGVRCGSSVKLSSTINPDLNGTYKIHTVSYSGDTHSNQWTMKMQSFLPLQ